MVMVVNRAAGIGMRLADGRQEHLFGRRPAEEKADDDRDEKAENDAPDKDRAPAEGTVGTEHDDRVDDRRAAAPATAVFHLLIGQDGLVGGVQVGKPLDHVRG